MKAKFVNKCRCGRWIDTGDEIVKDGNRWVKANCEGCKEDDELHQLAREVTRIMLEDHRITTPRDSLGLPDRYYAGSRREFYGLALKNGVITEEQHHRFFLQQRMVWDRDLFD